MDHPAPSKLYGHARDLPTLEPHYSRHVSALTTEGLHSKSDIAAELAWRDAEIARLQAERVTPKETSANPSPELWRRGSYYAARIEGYENGFEIWHKVNDGELTVLGQDISDLHELLAALERAGTDERWAATTMHNEKDRE